MLFKNPNGTPLTLRVGDGPGRFTDYTAPAGGFVEGPDGYLAPFKRKGFIPVDELPEDERPQIDMGGSKAGRLAPKRPKPAFDPESEEDDDDDDGKPEQLERAMSTRDRRAAAEIAAGRMPSPAAPPAPEVTLSHAPAAAGAKLTATGTMRVEDVEPLPVEPEGGDEPPQLDAPFAPGPGIMPPGALLPGAPLQPASAHEAPAKPKGSKK